MTEEKYVKVIDSIFQCLQDGSERGYIGEAISQLDHALQAAASAQQSGADDETILAALLHDIGQFVSSPASKAMLVEAADLNQGEEPFSVGVHGHERIGAEYLKRLGFSDKVTALVEAHVPVKRYLTGKYPDYYDTLSDASKLSLKYQGGPYTAEEVAEFEKLPYYQEKVEIRRWDDGAKVVDLKVPGLESYRQIAINHLRQQAALNV
ncbi:hypothetical protein K493DRAFT_314570 [Basidiobolus meristosporus CBS 931.73]|uniref:HD domain-containing protein n=1 Tax=Basidiobolus meristosporus CBS 931.73 TaxID=1314790 RepID=A0A1Y1XZU5_9FUNG|nr:hypothetical protein K493DRAFT_317414 [Basidiobolus meristosporus CBS 931.73]ORX96329.1 hypothetical protein K493DRAFT_314570 [Basidiobolus meristosporus CBS 931.73]|eukprot:ORX91262.1 hypothetical protein K493DRAFT_317414 [Basidiobolus meristosporus CBS 931.73]